MGFHPLIESTNTVITELEMVKFEIKHERFDSAADRIEIAQRYLAKLQREMFLETRTSGEVK